MPESVSQSVSRLAGVRMAQQRVRPSASESVSETVSQPASQIGRKPTSRSQHDITGRRCSDGYSVGVRVSE